MDKTLDAWLQAGREGKLVRLTIDPPDGNPMYRVNVSPISYNFLSGEYVGLRTNGTTFHCFADFIADGEVVK